MLTWAAWACVVLYQRCYVFDPFVGLAPGGLSAFACAAEEGAYRFAFRFPLATKSPPLITLSCHCEPPSVGALFNSNGRPAAHLRCDVRAIRYALFDRLIVLLIASWRRCNESIVWLSFLWTCLIAARDKFHGYCGLKRKLIMRCSQEC
jgi:hypothetical protein